MTLPKLDWGWIKKAFQDGGDPSSSRLFTIPHSLAAIFCVIFVTVKTGHLPNATETAAMGSFATVHYLVNRATTAWGKQQTDPK